MSIDHHALPPFHLAIPVHDISAAREFYGRILGFDEGRADTQWIDWNFRGHQLVTHQVDRGTPTPTTSRIAGTNPVDGHQVPVPHFGLVLT